MADRTPAEAELEQLRAGDDAVLALGEPCDRGVDRRDPGFGSYDGLMFGLDGDRSMVTGGA